MRFIIQGWIYKPDFVWSSSLRMRQPLVWILLCNRILASYPKSAILDDMTSRHALLLGIAPVGVFPPDQLPDQSVSSYLTISPLLRHEVSGRYLFCGTFHTHSQMGSHAANMGDLPCGVRTFLPALPGDCPIHPCKITV